MDVLYFAYQFIHCCALGLFPPFLTIVKSAALNICIYVFEYLFSILLGIYLWVEFLGHMIILYLTFGGCFGFFLQGKRHNQRNGTWEFMWARQPVQFVSTPLSQPLTLSLPSSYSRERWVLWVTYTPGLSPVGLCLAAPEKTVRWCTVSSHEANKCYSFRDNMNNVLSVDGPHVTCVKRTSYLECIKAIVVSHCCLRRVEENPYFLLLFLYLL